MCRTLVRSFALLAAIAVSSGPAFADSPASPVPSATPGASAPLPSATPGAPAPAPTETPAAPESTRTLAPEPLPSSFAPAPSATTPSVDPAITVRAMDWLRRLQTGNIDRSQLTLGLNGLLTPARVKSTQEAFENLGKLHNSSYIRQDLDHGLRGYQYELDFAKAKYVYLFEINAKDEIAGLFLSPLK